MPEVSVIIPFYNRLQWTIEAVQSVLEQTYTDFEIIIVDDGSTDAIKFPDWLKNDKRIVFVRKENKGVSAARNYGISLSKGQYIAFLDSDDLFLPDKLMTQVYYMEKYPAVYLAHTSYILVNEQGHYIQTIRSGKFTGSVYPDIINNCPIATPTVMVRKKILNDLKFPDSINIGEDTILWTQISMKAQILGIDQPLVKVRLHGNNAAYNPQKLLLGRSNVLNYSMKYDAKLNLLFQMKVLSSTYLNVACLYKQKNESIRALKYIIYSLIWPLNSYRYLSNKCLAIVFNIMPKIIKSPIKRILVKLNLRKPPKLFQ